MSKQIREYALHIICHLRNINKITEDTYQLLRNIIMAFKYLDEYMINKFITSLIRPKLEYVAVIWSPHKKKDIDKIEKI